MTEVLSRLLAMSEQERGAALAAIGARRRAGTPSAAAPAPSDRAPGGPEPASFGQEQLWILDQLRPGSARYNVPFAFEIHGEVDDGALVDAVSDVARRHPALRTSLAVTAGVVRQVVHDSVTGHTFVHDVRETPDPLAAAAKVTLRDAAEPFDLARPPLWRASLIRIGSQHRRLVWVASHAVADGWSVGVLGSELSAAYERRTGVRADEPQPDPAPFTDFSRWQRDQAPSWSADLAFWRRRLSELVPVTFFPGRCASGAGATVTRPVPDALVQRVSLVAAAARTTPLTVWLATYHLLLAALGDTADVAVGTVVGGRPPRFEETIGSFVNTVVIRATVGAGASTADFLRQVRDELLAALDHRDVPFVKVVEAVAPVRDGRGNPLCRTVLSCGSTLGWVRIGSALMMPEGISNGTVRFDAELAIEPVGEATRLRLEHDTGLLPAAAAGRFCDGYLAVLLALTAAEDATVRDCLAAVTPVVEPAGEPAPAGAARLGAGDVPGYGDVPEHMVRTLVSLWTQFLDRPVDPEDDFFAIGGHSMVAMRIVARMREVLGVPVELLEFFENPTVREQARLVDSRVREALAERVAGMSDAEVAAHLAAWDRDPPRGPTVL